MLIVGCDTKKIGDLKELNKSFAIKDLGPVTKNLGIKIFQDRKNARLCLSQESYIKKVLDRFNMGNAKSMSSPLAGHMKLSSKQCPISERKKGEMKKMPYTSVLGSLMYVMVCTRPDIAHPVGVVSRFFLIKVKNIRQL